MITMTAEQLEKIDLLDALFGAFSIEQLKQITETEEVVAKLKGKNDNPGILRRLVQEHDIMHMDLMIVKGDVQVLRSDMQTMVNLMFKPYEYNSAATASDLKSRYGVY